MLPKFSPAFRGRHSPKPDISHATPIASGATTFSMSRFEQLICKYSSEGKKFAVLCVALLRQQTTSILSLQYVKGARTRGGCLGGWLGQVKKVGWNTGEGSCMPCGTCAVLMRFRFNSSPCKPPPPGPIKCSQRAMRIEMSFVSLKWLIMKLQLHVLQPSICFGNRRWNKKKYPGNER